MAVTLDPVVLALLLGPMLVAFVAAIVLRGFIRAVIAFAAGSALLAGLFALLGAFFAAVLELTVGAGLTTVLFLVAITLTHGEEEAGVTTAGVPAPAPSQGTDKPPAKGAVP
jgi:uncharacterized MnhB-related membrane protein